VERQNELHVYRHRGGVIEESPVQVLSTLAPGKRPAFPQYAGAVHVHPNGRFVFVANRDDPHPGAEASHMTGDNTMAVFAIDARTGRASRPRHFETDAFHVRTFSQHGRWLVAASQGDVVLDKGLAGARVVPSSLGVFRVGADGALSPAHQMSLPSGGSMLFWCGFPAAYGSRWN
jgi:6-phosphogluconolactonase